MPDTMTIPTPTPRVRIGDEIAPEPLHLRPVARMAMPDACIDRLFFAQVREDSRLDVEALAPTADDDVVVVGSGGCTALALLAHGPRHLWSVDLNRTQHHLVELKLAALRALAPRDAVAFLGGVPMDADARALHYDTLRPLLGGDACAHWDAREREVERGVLGAGVSERFIALVVGAMRLAIHDRARIGRLLACRTLAEQRALYDREWNTRGWRLLFHALLNRVVFRGTYDPAFFRHVRNPSFARHFLARVAHGLRDLPVADNYFLHHMLTGRFPVEREGGVPAYLASAAAVARHAARLTLVDGGMTTFLRTRPSRTIGCFALSNIGEWLDDTGRDALFAEVARTAAPGARVVFRNFVGHTEVPPRWRARIVEDRARSESLGARDRSLLQARIAVCRVVEGT